MPMLIMLVTAQGDSTLGYWDCKVDIRFYHSIIQLSLGMTFKITDTNCFEYFEAEYISLLLQF